MPVTKNRRKIPYGIILFSIILIYLAYHVSTYFSKEQVSIYTVGEKVSLAEDLTATGIILRSEEVISAASAGYINYFVKSGDHCSLSTIVYSIDEDGSFNSMLKSGNATSGLSDQDLSELTADLADYAASYDSSEFSSVYRFKDAMYSSLLSRLNISSPEALKELGIDTRYFHTYEAEYLGTVVYYTDGYEDIGTEDINESLFDTSNYKKNDLSGGAVVSEGSDAYKLITSETWSVVVPLDEDSAKSLADKSRVNVTFNETGIETTVLFEEFAGSDGKTYGLLTTSKYMSQYADSRFIKITIDMNSASGLKIPLSAITTKDFYMVPLDYLVNGGNEEAEDDGVMVRDIAKAGSLACYTILDIFYKDDTYVYISKDQLTLGSILVKPGSESGEEYAVSAIGSLKGVYCVNKGYTVFRVVEVLSETPEYVIVKTGTKYGIAAHDHILLNVKTAEEGEKIY